MVAVDTAFAGLTRKVWRILNCKYRRSGGFTAFEIAMGASRFA
jgi:hypothetical protein